MLLLVEVVVDLIKVHMLVRVVVFKNLPMVHNQVEQQMDLMVVRLERMLRLILDLVVEEIVLTEAHIPLDL